jgi:hypothetical protein
MNEPRDEWENYCDCGDYVGPLPKHAKCMSCGRAHRGLYCTGAFMHTWVAESFREPPEACPSCNRVRWDLFIRGLNYKSRDRAYWVDILKNFKDGAFVWSSTMLRTRDANDPAGIIRFRRYRERLPQQTRGEDPKADYGNEVGKWLNAQISFMYDDIADNCINNTRFADMGVRKDMRRYRKAQANGCCGRYDTVVTLGDRRFTIGCNYGH